MSDNWDTGLKEALRYFNETLGLETHFLSILGKADDWAFVIQVNALLESAINHLYYAYINIDFEEHFAREVSHWKKVDLLSEAKILDLPSKGFILAIYSLRNRLAHSFSNVTFVFDDTGRFKRNLDSIRAHINNFLEAEIKGKFTPSSYKNHIRMVTILTIYSIYLSIEQFD